MSKSYLVMWKKQFFQIVFFFCKKKKIVFFKLFFYFYLFFIFLKFGININTQVENLKQRFCGTYLAFMIQLATILHHYYLFKLEN